MSLRLGYAEISRDRERFDAVREKAQKREREREREREVEVGREAQRHRTV
jgi:hypothetical protein